MKISKSIKLYELSYNVKKIVLEDVVQNGKIRNLK